MDATNLADLYALPLMDWAAIEARLAAGIPQAPGAGGPNRHTCWLTTLNDDGSPHVTGLGALWVDGAFWFETGERSRKGRNLGPRPAVRAEPRDRARDRGAGWCHTLDVLNRRCRVRPRQLAASGAEPVRGARPRCRTRCRAPSP